jgi:hypothetical protein
MVDAAWLTPRCAYAGNWAQAEAGGYKTEPRQAGTRLDRGHGRAVRRSGAGEAARSTRPFLAGRSLQGGGASDYPPMVAHRLPNAARRALVCLGLAIRSSDRAYRRISKAGIQIAKEHPDSPRKIDALVAAVLAFESRADAIAAGITAGAGDMAGWTF